MTNDNIKTNDESNGKPYVASSADGEPCVATCNSQLNITPEGGADNAETTHVAATHVADVTDALAAAHAAAQEGAQGAPPPPQPIVVEAHAMIYRTGTDEAGDTVVIEAVRCPRGSVSVINTLTKMAKDDPKFTQDSPIRVTWFRADDTQEELVAFEGTAGQYLMSLIELTVQMPRVVAAMENGLSKMFPLSDIKSASFTVVGGDGDVTGFTMLNECNGVTAEDAVGLYRALIDQAEHFKDEYKAKNKSVDFDDGPKIVTAHNIAEASRFFTPSGGGKNGGRGRRR